MKISTALSTVFLSIFFYTNIRAQIPLDWSPHVDSVANCKFLHNGVFTVETKKKVPNSRKYSIEIRDNVMKEHIGRYVIVSNIRFIDDCQYETTVTKSNVPGSYERIGSKTSGSIQFTATADNRIMVFLISDGKEAETFIFLKVSD